MSPLTRKGLRSWSSAWSFFCSICFGGFAARVGRENRRGPDEPRAPERKERSMEFALVVLFIDLLWWIRR